MKQQTIFRIFVLTAVLLMVTACGGATPTAAPAAPPATEAPAAASQPPGAPVSGQRTFVIVPEESRASYLVDEEFFAGALEKLGVAAGEYDVIGSTQAIAGQLQLDLDNLGDALGENTFTVQMNTFATDQRDRDNYIRTDGPRFDSYPVATFTATAIEGAPAAYNEGEEVSFKLIGDLTIREVTQPVTFDVTATLVGDTLTGVATAQANMSDFGIDPPNFANTLTVADGFGMEVAFTAREQ
jgi:polyisoprenoid-binding protein YceI